MNWDDLRYVLAVSCAAGLNAAARDLKINPSSLYRRLQALERRMGVRLFERLRSGYRLTIAGEELSEAAARIENEALTVERRLLGTDVRMQGSIRISTSEVLAVHMLADHLMEFRTVYPDVSLDVTLSNHHVDLSRRDADIVIRASSAPPEHLVGRSVGHVNFAAYATPAYLDARGRGRPLPEYDWIGYEGQLAQLSQARWMTEKIPNERVMVRFDGISAVHATALRGIACASLPCFVADRDPLLERLPGTYGVADAQMWVLTHPDLRRSARIRACLQFFGSRLGADMAKMTGRPAPSDEYWAAGAETSPIL
jgi:DNA-binding transcriptional LysR family regulator